jgi:hypothetical protein
MEWHCYTATLAVMTNVRGTGWDWPRNKFSLPSGARGRRKHTRLPKIQDRDHFREESTSAKRRPSKTRRETCAQEKYQHRGVVIRAKNVRRELRGVAASSSRTPTIENQAQPRKIERPSRRRNMEIGRARTPTKISSNASHITPPANKSTKRLARHCVIYHSASPDARNSSRSTCTISSQVLATLSVVQSSLTAHHKYLPQVTRSKREPKAALQEPFSRIQQDKGCGKKRRYFYYYYCSKKKKIGAREKRVLAPKNKLQHDS